MCMACGVPTRVPQLDEQPALARSGASEASRSAPTGPAPRKFAVLRNRDCRPYLFGFIQLRRRIPKCITRNEFERGSEGGV